MKVTESVLYWDTSAVLSTLFPDQHSELALSALESSPIHLLSSLAWSETHAVMGRMRRSGAISEPIWDAAQVMFGRGPWRHLSGAPDWALSRVLASKWPLRGADLWHLAMAKTLHRDLPEVTLLTYDAALREAAIGEGLA